MPTTHRATRPLPCLVALAIAAAISFAACASGAAPSPSSAAPTIAPSIPPPSAALPSADPGVGGGSSGDPGTGIGLPVDPTPVDPGAGEPTLVIPKPGQLNPRPVFPQRLQASVDGRHVLVKVTWTSGVEPCNVLDSVRIARSGTTIALTLLEGSSDLNAMCIEIAMIKATIVDLGELEPGQWTVTAPGGEAPPLQLTIA